MDSEEPFEGASTCAMDACSTAGSSPAGGAAGSSAVAAFAAEISVSGLACSPCIRRASVENSPCCARKFLEISTHGGRAEEGMQRPLTRCITRMIRVRDLHCHLRGGADQPYKFRDSAATDRVADGRSEIGRASCRERV